MLNLAYFFVDVDLIKNALDLVEASIKISLNYLSKTDIKLSKSYMLLSHLYLKSYNINSAIQYYEKYMSCLKKNYTPVNQDDKFLASTEKILDGLKMAAEELKKKHNSAKGKSGTQKIFDELIHKFVAKAHYDETKFGQKYFKSVLESYYKQK